MKTINIDGQECIMAEDAIISVLKDVKTDLYNCARRIVEIQELIETMQKIKEEQKA